MGTLSKRRRYFMQIHSHLRFCEYCFQARGITGKACSSQLPKPRSNCKLASMADVEREAHRDDCTTLAIKEASKSAGWALATSGILVSVANGISPTFQRALGVSGKAALVVSPTVTSCPRQSPNMHAVRICRFRAYSQSAGDQTQNWSPALLRQRDHQALQARMHVSFCRA